MGELLYLVNDVIKNSLLEDVEIIDFKGISPFNDYFIIASANNIRLANSVKDSICKKVSENGYAIKNIEGNFNSEWILIDLYDVIVHIFINESRYMYNLDNLWIDLPRIKL